MKNIIVKGARNHNLKNINLKIPRDKLIVITGLSGSGKSSLAFDTLYAEGQRRYVESLSSYARQFLSLMEKPDVDYILGLSPAISIEQKTTSHNPRSTVGTITEIYDYLRVFFARIGKAFCPVHKIKLEAKEVSEIVDNILYSPNSFKENDKIIIYSPIISNKKGEHINLLESLLAKGFLNVKINDEIYDLENIPKLDKNKKHNIDIIIDKLKVKEENKQRLAESIESALDLSYGVIRVENLTTNNNFVFSSNHSCPFCKFSIKEISPRLFSFNSPIGACKSCDGLGVKSIFDIKKVVNFDLSINEGAVLGWTLQYSYYFQQLKSCMNYYKIDLNTPFKNLTEKEQNIILYGSDEEIDLIYLNTSGKKFINTKNFEGVINNYERRFKETNSDVIINQFLKLMSNLPCRDCKGLRLNIEALNILVNEKNINEITNMSIFDTRNWFENLILEKKDKEIAITLLKEIISRLNFLINVGLDYLSLDRKSDSLSGGESQRIRLASQIGAGLVGVMYILDEPSIGLHQRDNQKLIKTLKYLRDLGNTVIVVEHDEEMILEADHIIDIGPFAGVNGGKVVAEGTLKDILNSNTLTAQYLNKQRTMFYNSNKKIIDDKTKFIELYGVSGNNLKNIDLKIPLSFLTLVTGVSGSGKSTLINNTLYPLSSKLLNKSYTLNISLLKSYKGFNHLDKVINIDQSPIGRTPRSNSATYTGIFTNIREIFSKVNTSRERGYNIGRFSFNVKGGRCEFCQGGGVLKIEMHFLSDVYVTCDKCEGKRYNRETLEVLYKEKNINDVLNMTVDESYKFFENIPSIFKKLEKLQEVGLGYIKLGQSALTLSGGEAQRVKLAKELAKKSTGKTLYILDEPTTGLHFYDINQLLKVIMKLKESGNTIIIIEHNLDVIKNADYIIDLGLEGGEKGGEIIAQGTINDIIKNNVSYTGKFLKEVIKS